MIPVLLYFIVGAVFVYTVILLIGKDEDRAALTAAMLFVTYFWPIYLIYLLVAWWRQTRKRG